MDVPVTIAIPNYNGARFVGETIESLLAQTFGDFKLFFLDDQSTDDSVRVVESFRDPRLTIVRSTERVTIGGNWNRGVRLADTPYFVLAHNDDVYEPDYLERMVSLIERFPSAFMGHCKARLIDESGQFIHTPAEKYKDALWPAADPYERPPAEEIAWLRKGNYVIAPSVIYRTSAVERIGLFDDRFHFVLDWHFYYRGALAGYTVVGSHSRLVRWRRHGGTASKALEKNLRSFQEEIDLAEWIAKEIRDHGFDADARPDYSLVLNAMLSEFAARLADEDVDGARGIFEHARSAIPGFDGSPRSLLMRGALASGRVAGGVLQMAESMYLSLLRAIPAWARSRVGLFR
jgi:GT2 family glycosyltransferase